MIYTLLSYLEHVHHVLTCTDEVLAEKPTVQVRSGNQPNQAESRPSCLHFYTKYLCFVTSKSFCSFNNNSLSFFLRSARLFFFLSFEYNASNAPMLQNETQYYALKRSDCDCTHGKSGICSGHMSCKNIRH